MKIYQMKTNEYLQLKNLAYSYYNRVDFPMQL